VECVDNEVTYCREGIQLWTRDQSEALLGVAAQGLLPSGEHTKGLRLTKHELHLTGPSPMDVKPCEPSQLFRQKRSLN
jgi:hypothetical protein